MINLDLYRPCVGMILLNKEEKIFIARRKEKNLSNPWQMPQGGMELGEDATMALLREMKEEIGTNNFTVLQQASEWTFYNFPTDVAKKLWQGRYIGQKQIWFLAKFEGEDNHINLNTNHPEFVDWKWASVLEVLNCVVNFKKEAYKKIFKYFNLYN